MRVFFSEHPPAKESTVHRGKSREWLVCEEAMLEAFG
jgi:hypothetical protein